jgi:hypothetical protein
MRVRQGADGPVSTVRGKAGGVGPTSNWQATIDHDAAQRRRSVSPAIPFGTD